MKTKTPLLFAPRRTCLSLAVLSLCYAQNAFSQSTEQSHANPNNITQAPTVTVIGTAPLPGLGQAKDHIPAPVQTATAADMQRAGSNDLPDFLNRQLGGVHLNEIQGNPLQADLNYRGYTASPILGTAQGMSVYLDGVRMNQPFGDVVSWDLLPSSAIANMTLLPGSNPLFGLNTLGGALSLQTKDGWSNPGTKLEAKVGSFSRQMLNLEHGGSHAEKGLSWYVNGEAFHDGGWRDDSASRLGRVFSKFGWQDAKTDLSLTLAHAKSNLRGNGLQTGQFLQQRWESVYTKPDITENRSTFLNLLAKHELDSKNNFSGNVYYRKIKTTTYNADVNEGSLDQSVYQPSAAERAALAATGYSGYPTSGATASNTPFPYWRCVANVLLNDEPGEKCNALINRTSTIQENYGLSGQWEHRGTWAGMSHQLLLGAAYDASRVKFQQSAQLGYLNPDRSVTALNAFADGVTGGNVDGAPFDTRVNLHGRTQTWSLFASDTLQLSKQLHLNVAGRFNETKVQNRDQIHSDSDAATLSGNHTFRRFNPAVGLTWQATPFLTSYLAYNEGSRAPSAIELGCANPDQPCKLPNAMAGDPPLKQVVTKTWEAGMRGKLSANWQWNAGIFRADNHDDILFVADNQAGYGYFKNFGQTRRQGLELGASGVQGKWAYQLNYTYLDATYQSHETVNGSSNSSNSSASSGDPGIDGTISIKPGDRMPLIPKQMLKVSVGYEALANLRLGLGMVAVAGSLARGNENAAHQADGQYYLGSGRSAGYAVFNFNANYQASRQLELFAQVNNLFDKRYSTAAQLGAMAFNSNGNFIARPFGAVNGNYPLMHTTFYAPGAPRNFWVGLRYNF